jgi:hypothetical protein
MNPASLENAAFVQCKLRHLAGKRATRSFAVQTEPSCTETRRWLRHQVNGGPSAFTIQFEGQSWDLGRNNTVSARMGDCLSSDRGIPSSPLLEFCEKHLRVSADHGAGMDRSRLDRDVAPCDHGSL